MSKDKCVMCGVETEYDIHTNVNLRFRYIDGAGQLCKKCYDGDETEKTITIPANLIEKTPNDMELGEKVRKLYYN
jgi:hypothetical protein